MINRLSKKELSIYLVLLIAILPLFFGFNIHFIIVIPFEFDKITWVILGLIIIFLIGRVFFNKIMDERSISQMRNHELINSLIHKKEKRVKWFTFPATMLMEELIFRFYAISVLLEPINLPPFSIILISSIIFAFYHIHFWFRYRDIRIFITYFILSYSLGMLNGYVFFHFGLIICFIIHYGIALEMYRHLYKKYYAEDQKT